MKKTVLIVDDAAGIRRLLTATLGAAGYDVLEAPNGKVALQLLDGRELFAIVTDLSMPKMNGLEFIHAAKRMPGYELVPVIILTASKLASDRNSSVSVGAAAWIEKPFSPSSLVQVLQALEPNT